MNEVEQYERQHRENYYMAMREIIDNNTISLMEEDIVSLLIKPPLDSMDVIKNKFYTLAKQENFILKGEEVDSLLSNYRLQVSQTFQKIKDYRKEELLKKLDPMTIDEGFRITKKEMTTLSKKIRKKIKNNLEVTYHTYLLSMLDSVFQEDTSCEQRKKFQESLETYLNKYYVKQLLENIDMKIFVKDTTLLSGLKEQRERYLFTKQKSHLFHN